MNVSPAVSGLHAHVICFCRSPIYHLQRQSTWSRNPDMVWPPSLASHTTNSYSTWNLVMTRCGGNTKEGELVVTREQRSIAEASETWTTLTWNVSNYEERERTLSAEGAAHARGVECEGKWCAQGMALTAWHGARPSTCSRDGGRGCCEKRWQESGPEIQWALKPRLKFGTLFCRQCDVIKGFLSIVLT